MTAEFRQKLLNWFSSILLLLATVALMMLIFWFTQAPHLEGDRYSSRSGLIAVNIGEILLTYVVLAPSIIVWHLLDFAQKQIPFGQISTFFASHRTILVTMGISQVGFLLVATGLFHWNSCDELPEAALPHSCRVGIDWWVLALVLVPLLFSIILCMGKGAITIRSYLTKTQ